MRYLDKKMLKFEDYCGNMKISVILGKASFSGDTDFKRLCSRLESEGHEVVYSDGRTLPDGTDIIMSVGGDGTFLAASKMAYETRTPIVGVNLGHLGFLSENTPDAVAEALLDGHYNIQDRSMLCVSVAEERLTALNEVCVSRGDGPMLGVEVCVDGNVLPTYWADGLMVSTPSGSTAYSLSVGGPIVMPSSKVLIIAPVAPHNLNVRPMIVPAESRIELKFQSRVSSVNLSIDNSLQKISADSSVLIEVAQFSLKRVCLDNSNFIKALSEKLFWGEDKRNGHDRQY